MMKMISRSDQGARATDPTSKIKFLSDPSRAALLDPTYNLLAVMLKMISRSDQGARATDPTSKIKFLSDPSRAALLDPTYNLLAAMMKIISRSDQGARGDGSDKQDKISVGSGMLRMP